jgi:hypothetical protein
MIRILASAGPGEVRVAAARDGELLDYALWRQGAPDGVGDLHVGRIAARVPAMAGAFVALAGQEGFLPDSAGAAGRGEGEMLLVRVTRAAQGGKGPRLTAAPGAATPPPRLLQRGAGPLHLLAARYADADILIDDAAAFAPLRAEFGARLHLVASAFDDAVETAVEQLGGSRVALPGGMAAQITPTPALVAIDLDGGAMTAARGTKSGLQIAGNRAAIPALARQIRLRNLGGAILVDFAGVAIKRRAALASDLAAALADDPARPRLLGFSHLGLAEILRPRTSAPLHEMLAGPHAAGLAALRQAARDLAADGTLRLALRAYPAVLDALRSDPVALPDLARRAVHPLILRNDPALGPEGWIIEVAA